MRIEDGHPDVSLKDWRRFIDGQLVCGPLALINENIDRSECCIPNWFIPLARGAAIASATLLRLAGHSPGMGRPNGWHETSADCFLQLAVGGVLMVRMCWPANLWTVEWLGHCCGRDDDEILVHEFGSTPIFTRSCESAMRLALYCRENRPPSGLRWIKVCPTNRDAAIELARRRRVNETLGAIGAQLEGRLH